MSRIASRKTLSWVIPAAVGSTALIAALSMGTFGAFSASITNDPNTAGAGSIHMRQVMLNEDRSEIDGTEQTSDVAQQNTARVESDLNNLYGGELAMDRGQEVTKYVKISHGGSVPANTFVLTPEGCQATPVEGQTLCDYVGLTVEALENEGGSGQIILDNVTLNALGTDDIELVEMPAAGEEEWSEGVIFRFTTTLRNDTPYTLMGESVEQSLTWQFDTAGGSAQQ